MSFSNPYKKRKTTTVASVDRSPISKPSKRQKIIQDVMGMKLTKRPPIGSSMDTSGVSGRKGNIRTAINTTTNVRKGRKYSPQITSKGVIHDYGKGERVLVKPKKNPRRKLMGSPVPEDYQIYDLPKGSSKRGARYYNKGGSGARSRFRPD